MYEFYYAPGACSLAAHIMLEEVGAAFTAHRLDLMKGEHYTPDFLAINPRARVPVLQFNGETLTECPAILYYLARRYPHAAMLPGNDPAQEAQILSWTSFLTSSVQIAFTQVWLPGRYCDDQSLFPAISQKGRDTVLPQLADMEQHLAGRQFLVGENYSIADPYLVVFYRWGELIGLDMQAYPNWTRAARHLAERPAVKRALSREGLHFSVKELA